MPRKREDQISQRKTKLSRDAAIIWALHKSKSPLDFETLRAETARLSDEPSEKANSSAFEKVIKYDLIRFLRRKKIVRTVVDNDKLYYLLQDYPDPDAQVFFAITNYAMNYHRWPSVGELAPRLGMLPEECKKIVYRLAPLTGWSPNNHNDLPNRDNFLKRLRLAAWLKLGCNEQSLIMVCKGTPGDVEAARRLLQMYPSFVPTIEAYRWKCESKEVFHYDLTWPDLPFDLPIDLSLMSQDAKSKDYETCSKLIIQSR